MKQITLTPYFKFGSVYNQGAVRKWGTGKWREGYAVRFMVVATANFDIFKDPYNWKITRNQNADYQKKENVNIALRSYDADLDELPKDAFKVKCEMIPGGKVTITLDANGHKAKFVITYEDAIKYRNDIEALAVTLKIPEIEDIPEIPEPDIPIEEKPEEVKLKFYQKAIKKMKDFFLENKWYVIAIYLIGLIIMGFINLPITILAWIFGVIGGTYLH